MSIYLKIKLNMKYFQVFQTPVIETLKQNPHSILD